MKVVYLALTLQFAVIVTLLRHNRRLTEAALVQTQPAAAAALRVDPGMQWASAMTKRRQARNPQAEPEAKPAGPGTAIQIGL